MGKRGPKPRGHPRRTPTSFSLCNDSIDSLENLSKLNKTTRSKVIEKLIGDKMKSLAIKQIESLIDDNPSQIFVDSHSFKKFYEHLIELQKPVYSDPNHERQHIVYRGCKVCIAKNKEEMTPPIFI